MHSGKDGRVTREDVLSQNEASAESETASMTTNGSGTKEVPTLLTERTEKISGLQKGMLRSMTLATAIPHMGLSDDVNMDSVVELKSRLNEAVSDEGVRITYMPIFIKALSLALQRFPVLNASLDVEGERVMYHDSHNISVAVATEGGLTVPNIKNVQHLSLTDIAKELQLLKDMAKANKLGVDELTGGTFTLSNIGAMGGKVASPVVLSPQVCIGAVAAVRPTPVVDDAGEVKVSHVMSVSWAADHRIVDGATLAMFNNAWKGFVENPEIMLLGLR